MYRSNVASCAGGTPDTNSAVIHNGPCKFGGFTIYDDGTNKPTITIYDNTTNSGREVAPAYTYPVGYGLNGYVGPNDPGGEECNNGLYVLISCAGAVKVKVFFK